MRGRPYAKDQPEPEPEQDIDLNAGDVLYLPRGTVHSATANRTVSVHVTVGVHPVLYADAVQRAVHRLCTEDVRFRRAFPPGFVTDAGARRTAADTLTELFDALRDGLVEEQVVTDSVRRATSIGMATLRHHLTDLEHVGYVRADTPVRRRPYLRWHLSTADDVVSLAFHNKTVHLPVAVADELRYVTASPETGFTGNDIPGELDEAGRVVLVDTLLREGFLTLAAG
jgi:hypothetical protein